MAGELKHPSVGPVLAREEWESGSVHELEGQQAGDMITAPDATTLTRLGVGAEGQVLRSISGQPAWGFAPQDVRFAFADAVVFDMTLENPTFGFQIT